MIPTLPEELIRSLRKLDHFDADDFLDVHQRGDQLVSVHMNPFKEIFPKGLWVENVFEPPLQIAGKVPWATNAYYLTSRPSFTLDPFFHAGNYYVQEASGMFLEHVLNQILDLRQALKALDLCAAPGGKSTLIQSVISKDSLLLSNEVIQSRVPVLYQNITKWGSANAFVTQNDPAHFRRLPEFFDFILIDAPCSGSGLFRKDPETISNWSPDLVRLCNQRQKRILGDIWGSLKEDGFLIYSTCSYSKEENEDILDTIFENNECLSVQIKTVESWGIVETRSDMVKAFGYRFYPDRLKGEGFFLAVIQKKQGTSNKRSKKRNSETIRIPSTFERQIRELVPEEVYRIIGVGGSFHLMHKNLQTDFEILREHLYLKKAGIRIGKPGENDWIPDHELALANILNNSVSNLELDRRDALQYLRGELFETSLSKRGWQLIQFCGQSLGWVKILDKRMNNYYPKSWRIRQSGSF